MVRCTRSRDSLVTHSPFPALMHEVLIADDHPLFRNALRSSVLQALPGAGLLERDGAQVLHAEVDAHPDLEPLLLDLRMQCAIGFSAQVPIRDRHPGADHRV